MSLDNIQLPASVVADMYKESLVVLNDLQSKKETAVSKKKNEPEPLPGLVVLTAKPTSGEEKILLDKMLIACKLSPSAAILYHISERAPDYREITELPPLSVILLFGVAPLQIGLPMDFPPYQVQQHQGKTFLASDSLSNLMEDAAAKKKLWDCLRKIFKI
jgi:hypothetical protein